MAIVTFTLVETTIDAESIDAGLPPNNKILNHSRPIWDGVGDGSGLITFTPDTYLGGPGANAGNAYGQTLAVYARFPTPDGEAPPDWWLINPTGGLTNWERYCESMGFPAASVGLPGLHLRASVSADSGAVHASARDGVGFTVTLDGSEHTGGFNGPAEQPIITGTYLFYIETDPPSITVTDVYATVDVHLVLTAVTPPSSGTRGNDTVVLTGGPFDGTEAVTFGGELALSVECPDPFTLICVTPPHPVGFVDVVVTNATYGSAIYSFFNYYLMESAPTIVNIAPLASGAVPIEVMTDATVTRGYNNGAITYWWRQVSGPEQVTIKDPDHVNTALVFERFVVGTYVFELAVTTEDAVFIVPSGMTIELSTQPPRVTSGRLHGS